MTGLLSAHVYLLLNRVKQAHSCRTLKVWANAEDNIFGLGDKLPRRVKSTGTVMNQDSFAVKRTAVGLGLFTTKAIPAQKRMIEYTGSVLTYEEANKRGGKYLIELDEKYVIDGRARSNIARYINHSCRPNARVYTSGGRVWIWSRRAIKAGEEITIDYGKEYIDEHIKPKGCKCKVCLTRHTAKAEGSKVRKKGSKN